jgi:mono/diheme cytochrome c family protein
VPGGGGAEEAGAARTRRLRLTRTFTGVAAAATIAVAALAVWWWYGLTGTSTGMADHTNPALVATGQAVYLQHCAACHGSNLEGQPDWQRRGADGRLPAPPHDVTGHTWHHPDRVLFDIVMDGVEKHAPAGYRSNMPAYRGVLSAQEAWAVLAYIKSTWPSHILKRQQQIDQLSRGS